MNEGTRRTSPTRRLLGLAACLLLTALVLPATPSIAAPTAPVEESDAVASAPAEPAAINPDAPQLSIAIDNGKTTATTGDKLDYVITVQNLGVTDLDALRINQSLPTGMEFGTADSDGTAEAGFVTWTVDLKATTAATFHITMTVTATPAELLRLATVACASIAADSPPIVCASHSDQLPAGAAAEAAQQAVVAPQAPDGQPWWYVAAGLAVVVGLGGLVAWWVIRRQRRAEPEEADALALSR